MGKLFGFIINNDLVAVLMILTVIDYLSAVVQSFRSKETSSRIGMNGVFRKVLMYLSIVAVASIQAILPQYPYLIDMFVSFFAFNEIISILETATAAGLPLPHWIIEVFEDERDKEPKEE